MRNIFRLRSVAGMRPLLILAALLFALTAAGVARPASASAADRFCSDAAIHPPVQLTDECFVRHSDFNQSYVAEMTANSDCDPVIATVLYKIRVRIVGDYEASGDKFHLRQFSIRYLSGRKPWAYFQIHVHDGNHVELFRPWNANGGWIMNDGAGRDVDNTMNLFPPVSYSPTFGANHVITFDILTRESDHPTFPFEGFCTGEQTHVLLLPSSLP